MSIHRLSVPTDGGPVPPICAKKPSLPQGVQLWMPNAERFPCEQHRAGLFVFVHTSSINASREGQKKFPPPPPELQPWPLEWPWTSYGLTCVFPTPAPGYPKWAANEWAECSEQGDWVTQPSPGRQKSRKDALGRGGWEPNIRATSRAGDPPSPSGA